MRKMLLVAVYTAFVVGANAAAADISALLVGDMQKLALHAAPKPVPDAVFLDASDAEVPLATWRGKWLVLNFWATWCAPCREEMPSLDRLQAAMPEIAVLPVATGRNPVPAIERFNAEAGVVHLPVLRDPKMALSAEMGVLGLPVTVIVDPEGREVARMIGSAEWDSEAARAVLAALIAGG